jgi:uncharacterized protein (TIGR02246 family)
MATTREVLDHHLKALAEGDLEGIMADYAPDAVLFTQGGPLKGLAAIRPAFAAAATEFSQPGATFDLKLLSVDGDHAYIVWTAETARNTYELGTDTFVIRDGKIVAQSFAGKVTRRNAA